MLHKTHTYLMFCTLFLLTGQFITAQTDSDQWSATDAL